MNRKNIISQITILALCLSLSFLISPSLIKADLIGNTSQATLSLSPATGSYSTGSIFNVDVIVNTNGQDVVVVAAYIKYKTNYFRADSIDTTNSIFTTEAEKTIDSTAGLIKITLGRPTPGVNTTNGKVATINFTAIAATSPTTDNITFDFAAGSTLESNVILDDGLGTDILTGVYNARYTVAGAGGNGNGGTDDLTPPAISSISVTSITDSGATINWTTNELANSQIEYGTTVSYGSQTSLDSNLVTSHSIRLSGLSSGTIYHYKIKSKDGAANLATTGDRTFTTSGLELPIPVLCGDGTCNESETCTSCPQDCGTCPSLTATNEGSIIKAADSDKIYIIVNGQRRWLTSPAVFLSYGLTSGSQKVVSQAELNQYPVGPDINQVSLVEGTLIKAKGDYRVYIIKPPYKRHIFNPAVFNMYQHFDWNSIREVESNVVNSYITSDFYRALNDYRVYSLEEVDEVQGMAVKHHLNMTSEQYTGKGYSWNQIFIVNDQERDYYQTGNDLVN